MPKTQEDLEMMRELGHRLREARKNKQISQEELASLIPGQSKSQISKYERGERDIPRKLLADFSNALGVSPVYLLGLDEHSTDVQEPSNLVPLDMFKKGKIVGDIACGAPVYAEECEDIILPFDADCALYCIGDSMIDAHIFDGDIVFIKCVETFDQVSNGKIAAVGIGDSYEYTLKRWFWYPEKSLLKLVPENKAYSVMTFQNEELLDVHLFGVAIGTMTNL